MTEYHGTCTVRIEFTTPDDRNKFLGIPEVTSVYVGEEDVTKKLAYEFAGKLLYWFVLRHMDQSYEKWKKENEHD